MLATLAFNELKHVQNLIFFMYGLAHSEPCQIKMRPSAKIMNGFQQLTDFSDSSILDVRMGFEYDSESVLKINSWLWFGN